MEKSSSTSRTKSRDRLVEGALLLMMELRLCSIEGARWLDSILAKPEQEIASPPKRFGLTIDRAIANRLKECPTIEELRNCSVEGFVLALKGVGFDSPNLITSVVHAMAAGAIADAGGEQSEAYEIQYFVSGRPPYSIVPPSLSSAGVYSCMEKETALRLSQWMHGVSIPAFTEQVIDMFGTEVLEVYLAVANDLEGTLSSVSIHGSDICCWQSGPRSD